MRTSRLQRRIGAITLPILVVALAACGGGSSNSQVASLNGATGNGNALAPTTTLSVQAREQKLLEFAACMRKNGVAMKDPTFDATGNMAGGGFRQQGLDPRSTEFRAGMKACGSIVQGIGFGRGRRGNFDPAKMQAAMNDFTSCLRDHGLTQVKDITFGRRPDGGQNGGQNGGGNGGGSGNGSGGGIFGGGSGSGSNTAGNGSTPPPGGFDGPPPGGSRPNDGGNGPGGAGFDPTTRMIERLNLDATDPTVQAAMTACKSILTNAFANNTTTTTAG
jgi:hypothetical protein